MSDLEIMAVFFGFLGGLILLPFAYVKVLEYRDRK
tara:strand:- start:591 stop:695 length:105 start_codon:yes stop_codon:yes gene_type:complete